MNFSFRYEPYIIMLLSMLASTLGIFISEMVFPGQGFLLSIAFVAAVLSPVIMKYIEREFKEKETDRLPKKAIHILHPGKLMLYVHRHFILKVCTKMFIGIFLAYLFWAIFIPNTDFFYGQINILERLALGNTVTFFDVIKLMVLALATGLMFGAGSYFLIGLLASTFGVFMSQVLFFIIGLSSQDSSKVLLEGSIGIIALNAILPFIGLMLLAYSGAVISIGITRYKVVEREFHQSITDGLLLAALSALLLFADVVL